MPGLRITVRALELNCYRGFGRDDWMPALIGEHAEPQDILISERPAPFRKPWTDLPWHEAGGEPGISARD